MVMSSVRRHPMDWRFCPTAETLLAGESTPQWGARLRRLRYLLPAFPARPQSPCSHL